MENILQEADRLTSTDRQQDYGHPLDDYTATAQIWSGILNHKLKEPLTAEETMLCMIGVKLSRESRLHKRDNLTDAAGYARCIEMVVEERKRRSPDAPPLLEKCPKCGGEVKHEFGSMYRCPAKYCGLWSNANAKDNSHSPAFDGSSGNGQVRPEEAQPATTLTEPDANSGAHTNRTSDTVS